jgi:hypothetical protein
MQAVMVMDETLMSHDSVPSKRASDEDAVNAVGMNILRGIHQKAGFCGSDFEHFT